MNEMNWSTKRKSQTLKIDEKMQPNITGQITWYDIKLDRNINLVIPTISNDEKIDQ